MTYISREEFYRSLDNLKSTVFSRLSMLENDVYHLKQYNDCLKQDRDNEHQLNLCLKSCIDEMAEEIASLKDELKVTQGMIFDPFDFDKSVLKGISNKEENNASRL